MSEEKKLLVLNWKMAFSVPQTCVTAHVIYEFDEVSTLVWEAAAKVFWQHRDGIFEPAPLQIIQPGPQKPTAQ